LDDEKVYLPGINVPEWIKNTDYYKNTVFNSVHKQSYFDMALAVAIVEANPNGLNEMMTKAANIFDTKFDEAEYVINRMSNKPVKVPAALVDALHLEEVFGEEGAYVGKAEANVLIAALELVQGVFDYASATDLSINFKAYKEDPNLFNGVEIEDCYYSSNDYATYEKLYIKNMNAEYSYKNKLFNGLNFKNCFGARSNSQMAKSKKAFVHAFDTIINSYDFLTGENTYYPEQLVEMLQGYGTGPRVIISALKNAINNGEKFAIPMLLMESSGMEELMTLDSWSFTEDEIMFYVDFGRLFTAGAFKGLFSVDKSGNYLFSYAYRDYRLYEVEYYDKEDDSRKKEIYEFTDSATGIYNKTEFEKEFSKHIASLKEFEQNLKELENNGAHVYQRGGMSRCPNLSLCLSAKVVNSIFPGCTDFIDSLLPEGTSCVEDDCILEGLPF